jgi:hypothetical protein
LGAFEGLESFSADPSKELEEGEEMEDRREKEVEPLVLEPLLLERSTLPMRERARRMSPEKKWDVFDQFFQ